MLLACHLFVGLILGLVLSVHFRDRRLAFFAAFGALLPDIIDKPLGHLLLAETVDSGRIFFHGIVVLAIIALIGILYLRKYLLWSGIALALGVLSHQLLDTMWDTPVNWWYPFLGPYPAGYYPDYFEHAFWMEVGSISEWVFFILSVLIVSLLLGDDLTRRYGPGIVPALRTLLVVFALATGIMGLVALSAWLSSMPACLMYSGSPETDLLLAVTGITGAAAMMRYGDAWLRQMTSPGPLQAGADLIG